MNLLLVLLFTLPVYAGGTARIEFEKTRHNFGYIKENNGDVTYKFKFTNTGDAPLLIIRTHTNCGCTASKFPKSPIAPGKSATIEVTYSPKGRPGEFRKEIKVYTNADKAPSKILIEGIVEPND